MSGSPLDIVERLCAVLAIVRARAEGGLKMTLDKAEVELLLSEDKSVSANAKVPVVIPVGISGQRKEAAAYSITIELSPSGGTAQLDSYENALLADAIIYLAGEMKKIRDRVSGDFMLGKFSIVQHLVVTEEGKLEVGIGAGSSGSTSHKLKLTFSLN